MSTYWITLSGHDLSPIHCTLFRHCRRTRDDEENHTHFVEYMYLKILRLTTEAGMIGVWAQDTTVFATSIIYVTAEWNTDRMTTPTSQVSVSPYLHSTTPPDDVILRNLQFSVQQGSTPTIPRAPASHSSPSSTL